MFAIVSIDNVLAGVINTEDENVSDELHKCVCEQLVTQVVKNYPKILRSTFLAGNSYEFPVIELNGIGLPDHDQHLVSIVGTSLYVSDEFKNKGCDDE